jgi:NAD(P)-dependent dehydrogenase (short-subunit alcohol dehydrogenase family)
MGALGGKVAIVTGGTSGIGERIAEVFVEEGAQVVVAARRQTEGSALETRLGLSFIRTDVSSDADVSALVDHTVRRFGRVDCLVNNAAIPSPMVSIADVDIADFDRVMAVNVRGVMLGMKYVAPVMLRQGKGSIVNIGSASGLQAGWAAHSYCASKGAVIQLTRSVAAELGEKGIRVNCISPGGTVTGIFAKNAGVEGSKADQVADVVKELFASLQPIQRAGPTDDIARAAVFLAGDGSAFVNGHDLVVDGGLTTIGRGWSAGIALRAELGSRIKTAVAAL